MHIKFVEIQNFRKLNSIRIEFAEKTTLFVGANNSGKTSAMEVLIRFLVNKKFSANDFTLSNWVQINKIGYNWEKQSTQTGSQTPTLEEWGKVLPTMDVWLQVAENEIHHVIHLLPTLDWEGGLLGIRLRFEPKKIEDFYKEYLSVRKAARDTINGSKKTESNGKNTLDLWPKTMVAFLGRRLNGLFDVRAYTLDQSKLVEPKKGIAQLQLLPVSSEYLDGDPLRGLIRIDDITAQRGLSDVGNERSQSDSDGQQNHERVDRRKLSVQLRKYYTKHLDPSDLPDSSDLEALGAIATAQTSFDGKLKAAFDKALNELESLGYPGITDPKLTISTKIKPMDGLDHDSAVQFQVIDQSSEKQEIPLCLPEQYNGLGYQNLISMVFKLMSFRDGWMRVGKAGKKVLTQITEASFPPLHLVLIEEPEAHLHAQVQQVFIRKAYDILRNHDDLKDKANLTTQLVVSTHSSHIAHECEFSCLRYFRRLPAQKGMNEVPTATVVNLSEVFGEKEDTQRFVTRYLKTTHCDLFFADAVILVEGPAERMLIPYFIREYFEELNQSYITVLEIGGSHAHRLQPIIDHLGLITLVITDLDASELTSGNSVQPVRDQELVTRNSTLKKWFPQKERIDELIDLKFEKKVKKDDQFYSVRVAYQCPVKVKLNAESKAEEALSNTFEDALVFENISYFKDLEGSGLIKKFNDAIKNAKSSADLGQSMFKDLKTGKKAEFALEMLNFQGPDQLNVPIYIKEGLSWLQKQVKIKQKEIIIPSKNLAPESEDEHR
ncbi:AAA family ATPase [bacterium]|nr:AAA family ATPase [bacterium]